MSDLAARIARTATQLETAARAAGQIVTADGRVSEATAATLLGISISKLRRLRYDGRLQAYFLGVNGGRISFKLRALAGFVEAAFDDFSDGLDETTAQVAATPTAPDEPEQ